MVGLRSVHEDDKGLKLQNSRSGRVTCIVQIRGIVTTLRYPGHDVENRLTCPGRAMFFVLILPDIYGVSAQLTLLSQGRFFFG